MGASCCKPALLIEQARNRFRSLDVSRFTFVRFDVGVTHDDDSTGFSSVLLLWIMNRLKLLCCDE